MKFELVIGTMESGLVSFETSRDKLNENKMEIQQIYGSKFHGSCINCIAAQGSLIASGGINDRIFVYDMNTDNQRHMLPTMSSATTAIALTPNKKYLIWGTIEGLVIVTPVGSNAVKYCWPVAHNGQPVIDISCDPTNTFALSLGMDGFLNSWDLFKGSPCIQKNLSNMPSLGSSPNCLSISTDGKYFTLGGSRLVEFWDVVSMTLAKRVYLQSKPKFLLWLNDRNCVVSQANGEIAWITSRNINKLSVSIVGSHNAMINGMFYLNNVLTTITSLGEIKLWACDIKNYKLTLIGETNTKFHPTCVAMIDMSKYEDNGYQLKHPLQNSSPLISENSSSESLPNYTGTTHSTAYINSYFIPIETDSDEDKLVIDLDANTRDVDVDLSGNSSESDRESKNIF